MRRLLALAALLVTLDANAAAVTGWVGIPLIADDGAGGDVAVPNVIGQASAAAADAILEGDGLDLGTNTVKCSSAAASEVTSQAPSSGTLVSLGTLVNVDTSSGTPCRGSPPLWLKLETDR